MLAGAIVALVLGAAAAAPAAPTEAALPALFGPAYPVEVVVSRPAALLHWLDSLAALTGPGMTAGKTVAAHREDYTDHFGALDDDSAAVLRRFAEARIGLARRLPAEHRDALSLAFLGAADVDSALAAAAGVLTAEELAAVRNAVERLGPRYDRIWLEGAVVRGFLERAERDERRRALSRFLVRMARFFGVPPDRPPHPRIVLAPVRRGHGTHAQVFDRYLLIEVRPGEGLMDQASPIVHENAHYLFNRIDPATRERWAEIAAGHGERGREAWLLLREALPTALGQGLAGQRFHGERFSLDAPWYHDERVDAYAKHILSLVREALDDGARLDDELVRRALALYLQ